MRFCVFLFAHAWELDDDRCSGRVTEFSMTPKPQNWERGVWWVLIPVQVTRHRYRILFPYPITPKGIQIGRWENHIGS